MGFDFWVVLGGRDKQPISFDHVSIDVTQELGLELVCCEICDIADSVLLGSHRVGYDRPPPALPRNEANPLKFVNRSMSGMTRHAKLLCELSLWGDPFARTQVTRSNSGTDVISDCLPRCLAHLVELYSPRLDFYCLCNTVIFRKVRLEIAQMSSESEKPNVHANSSMSRRTFVQLATVAGLAGVSPIGLGGWPFVPLEKGKSDGLFDSGARRWLTGKELDFIGMPIGGICAGTVYLGGDGKLWLWDIFNQIKGGTISKQVTYRGQRLDPGGGANYVESPKPQSPFEHHVAIHSSVGGKSETRLMESSGWKSIRFSGEYPKGLIEYADEACPLTVTSEVFSPYCPLDANSSGYPAIRRVFRVTNTGATDAEVTLGAWIQNPISLHSALADSIEFVNSSVDRTLVLSAKRKERKTPVRTSIIFENWDSPTYAGWKVEGDAFGVGPVTKRSVGALGGPGARVAKSYLAKPGESNVVVDARTGQLTSKEFVIERKLVEIWIGGGNKPNTACARLVIEGGPTLMHTGRQEDILRAEYWDVGEHQGKRARIEIVDHDRGFWGQIGVGQIRFIDVVEVDLEGAPDFGNMALRIHPGKGDQSTVLVQTTADQIFAGSQVGAPSRATSTDRLVGGVRSTVTLKPGATHVFTLDTAWYFPNLKIDRLGSVGNHYAANYKSSKAVLDHLEANSTTLAGATELWSKTWYDSTLPRWLLERTMGISATLSTMTCVRFKDSRFYAWEGIGCCAGTCGHVWQYAQSVGRLFPELERSTRETVDYVDGKGFDAKTGLINFRGEYGNGYAADSQTGYILRTYREHQTSPDSSFLKRVYSRMKQALEYLIREDVDANGTLEGRQHNTLDVDLYGPSSWLSSMYLAALRAGEEMAKEMGDTDFAHRCKEIFITGAKRFDSVFFNGEYYIQVLKQDEHLDAMRIGDGCHIDQLLGQWWAHQLGLGRVAPSAGSRSAMKALYKYNFIPDMGPFRDEAKPGRWYALAGEPGLVMTSFPKKNKADVLGPKPVWASMYLNECWTGCEYAAAAEMIHEGLVEEGLRVTRAVDERHSPSLRNPYNEVECSDHYARGMSIYSVFIALCGFYYHGPKGIIGFAPKLSPENFKAAFTAAEGWGSYAQSISNDNMHAELELGWGKLGLNSVRLEANGHHFKSVVVKVGETDISATLKRSVSNFEVIFAEPLRLNAGQRLMIELK